MTRTHLHPGLAVLAGAILAALPVAAAAAPHRAADGTEQQVNRTTEGDQYFPAAATNRHGLRLVVWTDTSQLASHHHDHADDHDHGTGHDHGEEPTGQTRVVARLLDQAGRPFGDEIPLDEGTPGNQQYPAVTALDDGSFVVAWLRSAGPSANQVRTVRLGREGRLGTATTVSQHATPVQFAPAISSLPGNRYVVAWTGAGSDSPSAWDAKARVMDLRRPRTDEFTLNRTTADKQSRPALARTAGGFVAAWTDASGLSVGQGTGVRGALLDAKGRFATPERQLDEAAPGNQGRPSLAVGRDQGIAVAWEDVTSPGRDGSGGAAVVRLFDRRLACAGPERVLSSITTGNQQKPRLTALPRGGYVAVWEDGSRSADDPVHLAVCSRELSARGLPLGRDRLVNLSTQDNQQQPLVTAGQRGGVLAVWTDESHAGPDTEATRVVARRLA
ncbi:hypothetical protein [Luteococcus peritonei]|uniref:Uncharacterized protein n=1 Tax=Luteococcus peritonei TaxID=88874 RepID=A0ABW4RZG6_9ACTN